MKTIQVAKGVYSVNYLINNPPPMGTYNKKIWKKAVKEYLVQSNFDFNEKNMNKSLENIEFNKITRIFKKLVKKTI